MSSTYFQIKRHEKDGSYLGRVLAFAVVWQDAALAVELCFDSRDRFYGSSASIHRQSAQGTQLCPYLQQACTSTPTASKPAEYIDAYERLGKDGVFDLLVRDYHTHFGTHPKLPRDCV